MDNDDADKPVQTRDDLDRLATAWLGRIKRSEELTEAWAKDATAAEAAFTMCAEEGSGQLPAFNILHSNVETVVAALYNSTPSPDIRVRHNNKDPVARSAADLFERAIATQVDDGRLDIEAERLVQDSFLAGRGVIRLRFDADEDGENLTNERIIYENVSWRDYREGPAARWRDVPWVAFRHSMTEDALAKIKGDDFKSQYADDGTPQENDGLPAKVWEIWDKNKKRVIFIDAMCNEVLNILDDPLGLPGFFPCPEPVQPIGSTANRVPVCPYAIYREQAQELDSVTKRINALIKGLKLRGGVIGDATQIERLAEAGDNELVALENMENLAAAGGLEKAIVWWPIDQAIRVLRELQLQREEVKQSIYEITGVSDIIRGASRVAETATAQQIKTRWGSLRIKKLQAKIERQIRDVFVMSTDIMALHFQPESVARAAGVELSPEMGEFLSRPMDHFRIDVESDSTVRADLTDNRQEMAEFLSATGQFFNVMAPIITQMPASMPTVIEVYSSFARQYRLGRQAEQALDQFSEQSQEIGKSKSPGQEAQEKAQQVQMAEFQHKQQMDMAELQLKQAEVQSRIAENSQQAQARNAIAQAELMIKQAQLGQGDAKIEIEQGKAEMDAIKSMAEIELEVSQQRPVAID